VMDYVMSNAAVARSFTASLGSAFGFSTAKWRLTVPSIPKGFNQIDIIAVVVVLIITLVICYRSNTLNRILIKLTLTQKA
jgi:hypothetical protein